MPGVAEGGCLCGRTRYRTASPAAHTGYCHCRSCRLAGGAPFVAWATFPTRGFERCGAEPLVYASSPPVIRSFCATCGSPLTYEHAGRPDVLDVTLATLDASLGLRPQYHIWVAHKLPWIEIGDGLPQHDEWR